ncbi:MAG: efflux RND transporter periplasmic adaptor subunit [Pirellulales bacterium]
MRRKTFLLPAALVLWVSAVHADDIQVSSVLVKLLDQVEVPARESGALHSVSAREGEMVAAGAAVAQIEDADVQFDKRRARMELLGANKEADNDVKVRFARKSHEVADAELQRAIDSERRFAQSVSQTELDRLRLTMQKTELEIEQAQLELELAQTARELKQIDVEHADHVIHERKITAPLAGFVAEVMRHPGEWVEPGQTILRILRLDRLRAEGLVNGDQVHGELKGRQVKLTVDVDGQPSHFAGTVTFVSPEIDPVNGQVRIWAEVDNPDLKLRPGLHGSMVISQAASE